jgi:hypothetical protein
VKRINRKDREERKEKAEHWMSERLDEHSGCAKHNPLLEKLVVSFLAVLAVFAF